MIQLTNISYSYPKSSTLILDKLSCDFPSNGVVGLIGQNGAGKTTLLDIISKNRLPLHGEVIVDSTDVLLLGQNMSFPNRMTALEAVEFTYLLNGLDVTISINKFQQYLGSSGAKRWKNISQKQMGFLSNGEYKWFCVVLCLSLEKEIYLLDEPTSGVDPEFRYEIWSLIQMCAKDKNKLFIVSGHLLNEMGYYIEKLYFLKNGSLETFENMDHFIEHFKGSHPDEAFVFAHSNSGQ
jgi:ABC-2 type transport system ATP-binding protein